MTTSGWTIAALTSLPKVLLLQQLRAMQGQLMAQGGRDHMSARTQAHLAAIAATGVGLYYGDKSEFSSLSESEGAYQTRGMDDQERRAWLDRHQRPGTVAAMPAESSCIGWAMENVAAAYRAAGLDARWAQIERAVAAAGTRGDVLARQLQSDGWTAIHFNADPRHPPDGDAEHPAAYRRVMAGEYYNIRVERENVIINYKSGTVPENLARLRQVPFYFGIARGGTHTFVGQDGSISELHWNRMPDDPSIIEQTPLEDFAWNSGVIMVPPGTWPAK